ncbi:TetR/AcrR family transcriptional regulator [Streptomyces sp. NPDC059255]|uniref:TetR/AcrR family transcriptional regulator n=1 Tax=Streptomyces sp. NPDC059255 TaxID=3346793 RepID=UPI00367A075B
MRRSRAALLTAAESLVRLRATTDVSVHDLAETAGVSRRVLYQHFGDRDTLLVATALHVLDRDLLRTLPEDQHGDPPVAALVGHVADNRVFYRAILTGTCAHAAGRAVTELFAPHAVRRVSQMFGDLDRATAREVSDFFGGAITTAPTTWLVDDWDGVPPEDFAARLTRIERVLSHAHRRVRPEPRT